MKFFIIHGSKGDPNAHWLLWLRQKLEEKGKEVVSPKLQDPPKKSLANWMEKFQPYLGKVNKETIFVGHSQGVAFTLNVLENIDVKVKACFLVAGFTGYMDSIKNKTFAEKEFDWKKIRANCEKFFCFASDNDPFIPVARTNEVAEKLGAEFILVKNAGHFQETNGYNEFPQLLKKINETCLTK